MKWAMGGVKKKVLMVDMDPSLTLSLVLCALSLKFVSAHDQFYVKDNCYELSMNPAVTDDDLTFNESAAICMNLNGALIHENQIHDVRMHLNSFTEILFIILIHHSF